MFDMIRPGTEGWSAGKSVNFGPAFWRFTENSQLKNESPSNHLKDGSYHMTARDSIGASDYGGKALLGLGVHRKTMVDGLGVDELRHAAAEGST